MLIWSLSRRPYIRLERLRQAVQSCHISACVLWVANGLSTLLLLLANIAYLRVIFQFNNTYLFLAFSWFVQHKVKITQSRLSFFECWLRNHGLKTHKMPSTHLNRAHLFIFPSTLPFLAFPCHLPPHSLSSTVLSLPFPSSPLVSSLLFSGCVIWMFLTGPAGLSTMSNRALAGTDTDALDAFLTPAGSVVTVALSGLALLRIPCNNREWLCLSLTKR